MDVCDIPAFYQTSEPVARKQYVCCECNAPILKGERHVVCRGKWDGKVSTFRQHTLCCNACEFIRDEFGDGDCIGFGCLKDEFSQMRHGWLEGSDHDNWKTLRSMMAKILWRERKAS